MNTALIIARYKEDLSWLKTHKDFNLYIYNKGSKLKEKEFKNVIKVEKKRLVNDSLLNPFDVINYIQLVSVQINYDFYGEDLKISLRN